MSIDILNMGCFDTNDQAIDIALPVLAIECEATPPLENFLDAYEETVLKLVSLGLSTNGISKTLNATESLVEEILMHLEVKEYAKREIGKPWTLTEDGAKYLDGSIRERASVESQYGYMFINTIKKEVLPYFYHGDIGKIALFRGQQLPLKLTIDGDENKTFAPVSIKHSKLRQAYRAYFKNNQTVHDYDEGGISKEEAVDLFADLESFDEAPDELDTASENYNTDRTTEHGGLKENMFIRALDKQPEKIYLRMRIIIDPSYPGGYKAESPFDFGGIDNQYFLRQMQWLEQSDNAYLDGKIMQDFLHREICKLCPSYKTPIKDFHGFLLERTPLLKLYHSRFPYIFEDMERIYSLMQRQNSLLEKENIVNNLARYVVEGLFNAYFRTIDKNRLMQIQQKAFDDIQCYGAVPCKRRFCRNVSLSEDTLQWISGRYLKTILGRITNTYGNSIMEKFINMLVIEYYLSDEKMHKFLFQQNIDQKYRLIDKLNRVRRKVSHDTDDRFTREDYDLYMANVFDLINRLLEAYRED